MKDDLLWHPLTKEMWVFCLEGNPWEQRAELAGFQRRRVWQAKKGHCSTVAFRVTSKESLLRLESSTHLAYLMPVAIRLFAFKSEVSKEFDKLQLTEQGSKVLWGHHLDDISLEALELNVESRHWLYTVVGDDGADAFGTGDPVFCYRNEQAEAFADHFEAVAKRHKLKLHAGPLTKETLRNLRLTVEG